jgi:hypothetical protein
VISLGGCGGSTKTVTRTVATPAPATTATAPPPTTTSAPSATAPAAPPAQRVSCGTAASHFIKQIQAHGADCSRARAVATAWLAQVQRGKNPAKPIDVTGYQCAARFRGQLAAVLCEEGGHPAGARIVFAAQP